MLVRKLAIGALMVIGLTATCAAGVGLEEMAQIIVGATQRSDNRSFINDNFVPELVSRLSSTDAAYEPELIDFDIFTYSQEPNYEQIRKTIRSAVKQASEGSAVITITFTQYEGDNGTVEYRLKKMGDRWLIDDIVYPEDEFSLRSGLGLQ